MSKTIIKSLKNIRYVKNLPKFQENLGNCIKCPKHPIYVKIHEKRGKNSQKCKKSSKIHQKSIKIFEYFENYVKCMNYPEKVEICFKMSKSNIYASKPLKLLDSWPFLIPSPDIQKTKFFQFLLLASSLAQKLKKFCFLDVWVGIHLVVSGYRVVIICILSKKGQKPPKFAHLGRLNRLT